MSDSDFIREVDEELRQEQIKNLWDTFGPFVIGFAILIVLGTAGVKGWDYWKELQASKSGDAFIAAVTLADDGKTDEALTAFEALKTDGTGGYPVLAEMRIASELAKQDKLDEAVSGFLSVAGNAKVDSTIQDLARIRANSLMLDQGKADEVITELTSMMDNNSYRHSARELVMLAYFEKEAFDKARPIAQRMLEDAETPSQMRQRAQIYFAYIRSKIGEEDKVKEPSQ